MYVGEGNEKKKILTITNNDVANSFCYDFGCFL